MRSVSVAAAVILLGLLVGSCGHTTAPSKDSILRETFYYSMALGPDTTSFATFTATAAGDTAMWSMIQTSWKGMRAFFSATLGQLGYGTGPFTWTYGPREAAALSHFQRDLGIAVTGHLDRLTVSHLARASKALEMANVRLPMLTVSKSGGYLLAKGTSKAVTNKLGYPVNTVNIVCDATKGECRVVMAEFISEALDQINLNETDLPIVH